MCPRTRRFDGHRSGESAFQHHGTRPITGRPNRERNAMLRPMIVAAAATLALSSLSATAQQQVAAASAAPPHYGAPIGHDAAMKAVAAAEAEAKKNNWS